MTTNDKDTKKMPSVNTGNQETEAMDSVAEVANVTNEANATKSTKLPKYADRVPAQKRIEAYLNKKGVEHDKTLLESDLEAFYARVEQDEAVPTREGFVECCHQEQVGSAVLEMDKDPFRPKSKAPIIAAIVAAVVILAACAGAYAYTQMTKVGTLTAQVNAEGWNKDTSTPVELVIYQGDVKDVLTDDEESNDPKVFKSVVMDANTPWGLEDITERGTYTLEVEATPVLEDGTLFKEPELQVISLEGDDITATFDLEKLDLSTASAEEVEEATAKAEEAAKVSGNEAAVAAAATATKKATEKAPATSNKNNASSGSSSASSNSGSSSSSSGSSSSADKPSKPAHTHSWQPVYGEKQVPVYSTQSVVVCDVCGASGVSREHMVNHAKAGEGSASHTEQIKVQTGTKTETYVKYYKCSCGATK